MDTDVRMNTLPEGVTVARPRTAGKIGPETIRETNILNHS